MNTTTTPVTPVTANTTDNTTATPNLEAVNLAEQAQAVKTSEAANVSKQGQTEETTEKLAMLAKLGERMGEFKAYDSQLPLTEIKGTRLVKCLYLTNPKTGLKAQENAYIRIPTKHLTEEEILRSITSLTPHVLTWLQGLEDIVIKEAHKKVILNFYTESMSLDAIIERLEETNESSRLNKDKIEAWFTENVEEILASKFLTKMGVNEDNVSESQLAKLDNVLQAYKAKFATLASPKAFIKEEDCNAMIKVINECELSDSLIGSRFINRLTKMQEKEEELLLEL